MRFHTAGSQAFASAHFPAAATCNLRTDAARIGREEREELTVNLPAAHSAAVFAVEGQPQSDYPPKTGCI